MSEWDRVKSVYERAYLYTDYAHTVRGLLQLISAIEDRAEFADVIPRTSHVSLVLDIPDHKPILFVWYNEQDNYEIAWPKSKERIKADGASILEVLISMLDQIRKGEFVV
jgi:hypothetical protein